MGLNRQRTTKWYGRGSIQSGAADSGGSFAEVREFVAGTIGTCTANGALLAANRAYVRKLDSLLVQILQVDWPQEWPTFMDDLLTSSHADRATCENNLVILRLLSEAMHEHYEQNLSTQRWKVLRANLVRRSVLSTCRSLLIRICRTDARVP